MTLDEIRAAYTSMTPEERRAALPLWYEGGYLPAYPEWEDLYGDEEDGETGVLIAAEMAVFEAKLPPSARRTKLDWSQHADDIQRLIEACRLVYLPRYKDWLARNAPEGTRWRAWRSLTKNDSGEEHFSYEEWTGPTAVDALRVLGITSWGQLFAEDHEKAIDQLAGRRPSKDGIMQHGLGVFADRPTGTAPMRAVYDLIRRFYVGILGLRAFAPAFPFTDAVVGEEFEIDEERVIKRLGGERSRAAKIKRDEMNTAAKFLSLILKEVDHHFDARQAGLVARAFYKRT